VKAGDRPEIEDNEFYSLDLVGMRVTVKVHTSLFYFSRYCPMPLHWLISVTKLRYSICSKL